MTQVFITHGYTANGNKHWFPWLEEELAKLGIPCKRLKMPDSISKKLFLRLKQFLSGIV